MRQGPCSQERTTLKTNIIKPINKNMTKQQQKQKTKWVKQGMPECSI